jgi:glycerophosphoryl diester phosphodiesterase
MTKIIAWGQYVLPSKTFQPPGNSLRIIDAAFSCGYDGIELDVQLSKDDDLVLMHDHTLDRTTNGTGRVRERTVEELSRIILKDPWKGVPCFVETLTAALRRVADRGMVMVDMNNAAPRNVAARAESVVEAGFHHSNLLLLTYKEDGGILYKEAFPDATVLLKAPYTASLQNGELDLSFVERADKLDGVLLPLVAFPDDLRRFREKTHAKGKKLAVYMHKTGPDDLVRLMEAGVDYITSCSPYGIGQAKKFMETK